MTSLVLYPDAALVAIDYLEAELALRDETYAQAVTVSQRVPNPRGEPLVVVRRSGGTSSTVVLDRPRLDAQVWHADEFRAQQLAQLVRALLLAARGRVVNDVVIVGARDFLGPTPISDPESAAPRYLLTVEWTLRGATA